MINDILFHQDFPANYQCSPLDELPGNSTEIRYFNPSHRQQNPHDGLLASIETENGISWIGMFEWGDPSFASGVNGFWSMPNDDCVCAVSRGVAYIVPVTNVETYDVVQLRPISLVFPVPSFGVLILGDFVRLTAFGKQGKLWTTPRLSWDGLELSGVKGTHIIGNGWDAPNQKWIRFSVNLETGVHEGGSTPPT
jgi:hypothetical protein